MPVLRDRAGGDGALREKSVNDEKYLTYVFAYAIIKVKGEDPMTAISVTKARENIYQILAEVNTNSQPITITNNRGKNGVLISEDDWNAIQETLYLNSIPGVAESIIAGGNTPLRDCVPEDEVEW